MAFWSNWFSSKRKSSKRANVVNASVLRSVSDRENSAYFTGAKDSSSDDICSSEERSRLRAECRKILLDCPSAAHAARSLALNVYGAGPAIQVKSPDEHLNTSIERLFNLWRRQTGYDQTFFTAVESLASDGESFFNLVADPTVISGISVELIEPYRIESKPGTDLNANQFCGIEYDEFGKPLSYTVQTVTPNPSISRPYTYETLPASRIEHLFVRQLPGQKRGLPLLQSAVQTLASLRKIEDSVLSACETAASISFLVESDYSPDVDPDSQLCGVEGANGGYVAFDEIRLPGRNSGLYLPSGMRASQLKSEQPNVNYKSFREDCLLGVGSALGAPKNIILNDSSSYNYSSARLDAQTWERWATILQGLCTRILDSHFRTFLSVMSGHPDVQMLLGSYQTLDEIPVKWFFPKPTHIDRQKEASADIALIQNNCLSLRDYYAAQGKDWRVELNQIALERKTMRELGISLEDTFTSYEDEDNDSDTDAF